jgi:hypothetical protein
VNPHSLRPAPGGIIAHRWTALPCWFRTGAIGERRAAEEGKERVPPRYLCGTWWSAGPRASGMPKLECFQDSSPTRSIKLGRIIPDPAWPATLLEPRGPAARRRLSYQQCDGFCSRGVRTWETCWSVSARFGRALKETGERKKAQGPSTSPPQRNPQLLNLRPG